MELKKYQKRVISDLGGYLSALDETRSLNEAFSAYWANQMVKLGVNGLSQYQNIIDGVPHVCYKVPTGGGKTFLACASIKPIFDALPERKTQAVVWLVPSDAILKQTLDALKNPQHPYRQRLNTDFTGRVEVYSKEELLAGENFKPTTVVDQLSVMVLSYDSFRSSGKEGLKAYQANSNLASFRTALGIPEQPIENADQTALFQVINQLNPVVIVDESHHARTQLSIEMLQNFNPAFVLDLTATPRKESNIISYVDALQLKNEHMVKLPVIAYNRDSQTEVITDAIGLREVLESMAEKQKQINGDYIRPIVLFQAQPRNKEDATSFEKLRKKLVDAGIPEDQIAIKTAEVDELKNTDLLSEDCKIRYIITVNALKEGWDCPFAYILASLANKTSTVDVEQIVGRILRQPNTREYEQALLNMSYVLTSSVDFRTTLNKIVAGLNEAGFTAKDCRAIESEEDLETKESSTDTDTHQEPSPVLPFRKPSDPTVVDETEEFLDFNPEVVEEKTNHNKNAPENADSSLATVLRQARDQGAEYELAMKASEPNVATLPLDIQDKVDMYEVNQEFSQEIETLRIPQFFIDVPGGQLFGEDEDDNLVLLQKEHLSKGFLLKGKDYSLDLQRADEEMARIDVERANADVPKAFSMDFARQQLIRQHFASLPPESKRRACADIIYQRLDKRFAEIAASDLKQYVKQIVDNLDSAQLLYVESSPYTAALKVEQKILDFLNDHRLKTFRKELEVGRIITKPFYKLPSKNIPFSPNTLIGKSLYAAEDGMNGLEEAFAMKLSGIPNVKWWHRIIDRKGFCLNGPINHYPDFMVMTRRGRIVLVETKGEQLKNDDSKMKLSLGKEWEKQSGSMYRYFMVFKDGADPLEGAHTMEQALDLIGQL